MSTLVPARLPAGPAPGLPARRPNEPAALVGPWDRWTRWRTDVYGGWRVDSIQPTAGSIRVTPHRGGLTVVIGDGPQSRPWCTTVELHADGTASVHRSASPPCVLLTARDVGIVPKGPESRGRARLEVGDRLLMMSAEALGALPNTLSAMRRSATSLDTERPGELLERLLHDLPSGAAAVAVRTPRRTSDATFSA
jgi:hypothetical protein